MQAEEQFCKHHVPSHVQSAIIFQQPVREECTKTYTSSCLLPVHDLCIQALSDSTQQVCKPGVHQPIHASCTQTVFLEQDAAHILSIMLTTARTTAEGCFQFFLEATAACDIAVQKLKRKELVFMAYLHACQSH